MAKPIDYADACDALARVRLASYTSSSDKTTLENYAKNMRLGAALYPSLQTFEVVFRNRLERALVNTFGVNWYQSTGLEDMYFKKTRNTKDWDSLSKAVQDVQVRKGSTVSGDIVATLHFGFWQNLLIGRYENDFFFPNAKIISPFGKGVRASRSFMWSEVEMIRKLRNRIAHHEPIITSPTLIKDYDRIIDLLNDMNPETRRWLKSSRLDRFRQIAAKCYP